VERTVTPPSPVGTDRTGPPPQQPAHLSTLRLHQLRTGELDPPQARAAQAHLDACPDCRRRMQSQQAFRHAFELQPPPVALPSPSPSPWAALSRWARWAPLPVLVAALALVAVRVVPSPIDAGPDAGPDAGSDTRLKGAQDLVVLVAGHGVLDPGEAIHPGDRLQLRVPAGAWQEAWVGDADGLIGHFELQTDRPTLSPFALTVDGEPGDEHLFVVLSDDPLDEEAAEAALAGRRMDGVSVRRLDLDKEH